MSDIKSPSIFIPATINNDYVDREVRQVAEQILIDQSRWLDEQMEAILSEKDKRDLKSDAVADEAKAKIFAKYGLKLEIIADCFGLRLWKDDKKILAEFRAKFEYEDGQKIWVLDPGKERPKGDDGASTGRTSFLST